MRRISKEIKIGNIAIGGANPIAIQSMTNTDTSDVNTTLEQINALYSAGCEIVRVAVPDETAAKSLYEICKLSPLPVVADIHFNYKLALTAVDAGISKIRINPGNIGDDDRVKQVVNACKLANIPIRIGVNSGSVERHILAKFGGPTPDAMVESALYHVNLLNKFDFNDICISLKSSSVQNTVNCYVKMSEKTDLPLHLGVTEAGTKHMGTIKSAAGIGGLLALGIGDTIRVSLTDDPVEEIAVAKDILKAVGITNEGVNIISCPTCGRTKIGLIEIANEVEQKLANVKHNITVAVMGCVVNGPGEAREADFGIAGGIGEGLIFKKGEIIRKVPQDKLVNELLNEIYNHIGEMNE